MIYLLGKKSVVTTNAATLSLQVVQEYNGYSMAYDWLVIDQETGRITIDAHKNRLIRKDSQKRVINFVRQRLLSYDSIYKNSGVIKNLLSDYDNLIATVMTETKKRKININDFTYINDIFPVEIIVRNPIYFL